MLNEYLKNTLSRVTTLLKRRLSLQRFSVSDWKTRYGLNVKTSSLCIRSKFVVLQQGCTADEEKARGVIAASAGNHAPGLAAKKLGVKAVIVMPRTTPEIKVKSVKARGARVILHGDAFDEAFQYSQKLVEEKAIPISIHTTTRRPSPDNRSVWKPAADAGSSGCDIYSVGGGGLITGVAYIKALAPEIRIVGVRAVNRPALLPPLLLAAVVLPEVGIFADGVAVAQIGEYLGGCKDHVDEVITCTPDEICAAIKDTFDDTRAVSEPAGAWRLPV